MSWNELEKTEEVWAELLSTGRWFQSGWFMRGWFYPPEGIVIAWTELNKESGDME